MDKPEKHFLGMDQSNLIQFIIMLIVGSGLFFTYNEFVDTDAREIQHIIEVEEKLLEKQIDTDQKLDMILEKLEKQNGRVDQLESDGRLLDYRVTEVERGLESP